MTLEQFLIITLILAIIICVAGAAYMYIKDRTLEELRTDVYKLFLEAEHMFLESCSGKQKMKYVVQKARSLLPVWAQLIISEELLIKLIQCWFTAVKDLLDDGKVNNSQEGE